MGRARSGCGRRELFRHLRKMHIAEPTYSGSAWNACDCSVAAVGVVLVMIAHSTLTTSAAVAAPNANGLNYYLYVLRHVRAGGGNYQVLCANCNFIKRAEMQECPRKAG